MNPTPQPPLLQRFGLNSSYWGYFLLLVSVVIFVVEEQVPSSNDGEFFTWFSIHYLLAFVYVIILIRRSELGIVKSWHRRNIHSTILLLQLFLVSAYALNRSIPVFAESVTWLCFYIVLSSVVLLSFRFFDEFHYWINCIQYAGLGAAGLFYFYLSVYVMPYYIIGGIGIIALGLGTHIFVPVFLLIGSFCMARYYFKKRSASLQWMILGCLLPIGFVTFFFVKWNDRVDRMESITNKSVMYDQQILPVWIKVAETIPNDWITKKILKSELVYTVFDMQGSDGWLPTGRWQERRKHDPLVFICSAFKTCSLSEEERIQVLQTFTDSHHESNERLWSGDNLSTSYIVTDVDIYPAFRMAYAEKYLTIRNNHKEGWRGNSQEAIYTFQLPEGAVVTSLSLWIDGKEEKAILTSKQKATNAYKTIVGVEQRDPSVVHWQEGNRVTVRVFPCTPQEDRRFKIGITTVLPERDGKLKWANVKFKGPSANKAKEVIRLRFPGSKAEVALPSSFKHEKGFYVSEGNFDSDLEVSIPPEPIPVNYFTFNGFTYSLGARRPVVVKSDIKEVFLDINANWNQEELKNVKQWMNHYRLYAFVDEEKVALKEDNWDETVAELSDLNFSLLPFYKITDSSGSLVVTKGAKASPYLSDFQKSVFAERMEAFFAKGNKINVFNIGDEPSVYIKSLREFRGVNFASGTSDQLNEWLEKRVFIQSAESDNKVILSEAGLELVRTPAGNFRDNAPDHLARLFAYNSILRKIGADYFKHDFVNDELVEKAASAYVVSPVSSLIVLESREDYERFGITDKDNSLANASKEASGAVPEPHEWLLIALFGWLVLYMIRYSGK